MEILTLPAAQQAQAHALAVYHFEQKRAQLAWREHCEAQKAVAAAEAAYYDACKLVERFACPGA